MCAAPDCEEEPNVDVTLYGYSVAAVCEGHSDIAVSMTMKEPLALPPESCGECGDGEPAGG